jgi:hypothetical protein
MGVCSLHGLKLYKMLTRCSITKLMGEAFKLHSQALVGYEDAMSSRSGSASPSMAAGGVQVLEMQMAY